MLRVPGTRNLLAAVGKANSRPWILKSDLPLKESVFFGEMTDTSGTVPEKPATIPFVKLWEL